MNKQLFDVDPSLQKEKDLPFLDPDNKQNEYFIIVE